MILLNVFIGFFAIFLSPQIFLYYKYNNLNYSLILTYGIILSFTGAWFTSLVIYYLDLPNIFVYILACFITILSLAYMFLHKEKHINRENNFLIWLLVLIIMLPLLQNIGIGLSVWDALASWNKWAMELFENKYYPIDAAYPVLMPAIWSLIYKIQGSSEIWWTAQATHVILPLITLAVLLSLYNETKNKTYIFMAIFIYPYLISIPTINGNMDMPVMIMGTLSIIILYAAETNKNKLTFEYYVYASLLLAGISSIVKQAGFAFILFDLIYILLNLKFFTHKKRLLTIILLTFIYFLSYLTMYYQNNIASPAGNFKHLGNISNQNLLRLGLTKYFYWLYDSFFSLPASIPYLAPLMTLTKIHLITPILIISGLLLYVFKDLRKYNSVGLLSGIFFILGTIVWVKFFSYDPRNSNWVKAFFIIFVSINFNYLITRYQQKAIYTKLILSTIILGISIYLFTLGDKFVYEKQKISQEKIGLRYGSIHLVKYMAHLLEGKDPCVKIYTNDLPLPHNYNLKAYKNKFIVMGRDYKYQSFKFLEHSCTQNRYIIFRINAPGHEEWWKVTKLINDGIIKRIPHGRDLVYSVPPNIKIQDSYFKRTDIVNIKLFPHQKNIKYTLDKYKENNIAYTFTGWAFVENTQTDQTKKYLLLKNKHHDYIIRMRIQKRPDVTKSFKAKNLDNSGFLSYIYKEDLQKGIYDVHIILIDDNNTQYQIPLNKKITI